MLKKLIDVFVPVTTGQLPGSSMGLPRLGHANGVTEILGFLRLEVFRYPQRLPFSPVSPFPGFFRIEKQNILVPVHLTSQGQGADERLCPYRYLWTLKMCRLPAICKVFD